LHAGRARLPRSDTDKNRTGLSQHFEQIFFVSHGSTFDRTMFPYHIYIENGMVVENNLPPGSAHAEPIAASTPVLPCANGHNGAVDPQALPLQLGWSRS